MISTHLAQIVPVIKKWQNCRYCQFSQLEMSVFDGLFD